VQQKATLNKNDCAPFSTVVIIEVINAYTSVKKFSHAFDTVAGNYITKKLALRTRARGLARNQAQKSTPDRVKFSSVDERVDADIEICDGQHSIEVILINPGLSKNQKKNVDIHRTEGDREQPTDEDHGLNDAGLNLVRLVLSGV